MPVISLPILSTILWLPIVGGIVLLISSKYFQDKAIKFFATIISLATIYYSFLMLTEFNPALYSLQLEEIYPWFTPLNIYYALGVDGFSVPLIALTCFMTLIVCIASFKSIKTNVARYLASFLIMQGLMCGVFMATDAILFYIFFEAMLIPMFLIIGIWGGNNRVYAAIKFFLYTFLGSLFLLIALIYLHYKAEMSGISASDTFAIESFHNLSLSLTEQKWIFWALLVSFAVKIPMWPVHTWLPDAHVEAPTGGSVILAAITLKMGGYGFLRFIMPIVPNACVEFAWIIIALSLIAVFYIGFVAIAQKDMKKLIAYSSISHMGLVTLGLFLVFLLAKEGFNIPDMAMGIEGAMVQMVSHGFISGALFLGVGVLYDRMHTKKISDFGGVVNKMPAFAALLMLFAMANAGLPGTSGFVGEFLVILAAFKLNVVVAAIAATTLILGATYTLWMYKRVIFGDIKNPEVAALEDIYFSEKLSFWLLAIAVLFIGLWPAPLLNIMRASVQNLVAQIVTAIL